MHQNGGCLSMGREKAKMEQMMKMKTVRMTVMMALCFTICQVLLISLMSSNNPAKIPAATLYFLAWQRSGQMKVSPTMVETMMALRVVYVVIVPILHGSVMERSKQEHLQLVRSQALSSYSLHI